MIDRAADETYSEVKLKGFKAVTTNILETLKAENQNSLEELPTKSWDAKCHKTSVYGLIPYFFPANFGENLYFSLSIIWPLSWNHQYSKYL